MCLLNLGTDVTFNCCCPVEHYVVVFSVGLLCIVLNFSVVYYCAFFFCLSLYFYCCHVTWRIKIHIIG